MVICASCVFLLCLLPQLLISGSVDGFDVDDLRAHSNYTGGYHEVMLCFTQPVCMFPPCVHFNVTAGDNCGAEFYGSKEIVYVDGGSEKETLDICVVEQTNPDFIVMPFLTYYIACNLNLSIV